MITGYIGLIGHGKTMLAVTEARRLALRRGAILAANIKIQCPTGVEFVQLTVGEDGLSVEQLEALMDSARATGRGVVILIDEIGIIMPARFWQSFPIALMYRISQSRKYATDMIWTSQDEEDVDAYLRRKTQWIYKVRAIPSPSPERRENGTRPWVIVENQWRPGKVDKPDKRIGRRLVRYRREREAFYDTDELVRPPARLTAPKSVRRRSSSSGFHPDGQRNEGGAGGAVTSADAEAQARVRSDPSGLTGAPDSPALTAIVRNEGEHRKPRSGAERSIGPDTALWPRPGAPAAPDRGS